MELGICPARRIPLKLSWASPANAFVPRLANAVRSGENSRPDTFPSAWYQPITVGVFAKALGMSALWFNVVAICIIALAYLILSLLFLRKQET